MPLRILINQEAMVRTKAAAIAPIPIFFKSSFWPISASGWRETGSWVGETDGKGVYGVKITTWGVGLRVDFDVDFGFAVGVAQVQFADSGHSGFRQKPV